MINPYDLTTHFGACLSEIHHFVPNGTVAFMSTEILRGFADASGQESTETETVVMVSGCLSTTSKWQQFDDEWQEYLRESGFKPDPKTGRYVFHTASFHSGNSKLMPDNLSRCDKQRIYKQVVDLVVKHSIYRFGFGVWLEDFRRFECEIPHVRLMFKQPGTFVSRECFRVNSIFMEELGFNPSVSYMFDRGDEFWGELFDSYREDRRQYPDPEDVTVRQLLDGNKADFSPLQAADIVAWECANHFRGMSKAHRSGLLTAPRASAEFLHIRNKQSHFGGFQYQDLVKRFRGAIEDWTKDDERARSYIGPGKQFENLDEFGKAILASVKEYDDQERQELLNKWFAKKEQRRT